MTTTATPDAPVARPDLTPVSGFRPYRITVDVYRRLTASGALGDKSRVFLWDGQLVQKVSDMSKGRAHVFALNRLARLIAGLVPAGYFSEQDQPIELDALRVPEPDLKIVRGGDSDYRIQAPTARDCPMIVEVSDSSLVDDTGEMLRAYASANIPVYWVVNIPNQRIDVYSQPVRLTNLPGYAEVRTYAKGENVPVILDGREVGFIAVSDVLP